MSKEWIVECEDGKLFHLTLEHPLFKKSLTCKELHGNTSDLGGDYIKALAMFPEVIENAQYTYHLELGKVIWEDKGIIKSRVISTNIVKIFTRTA